MTESHPSSSLPLVSSRDGDVQIELQVARESGDKYYGNVAVNDNASAHLGDNVTHNYQYTTVNLVLSGTNDSLEDRFFDDLTGQSISKKELRRYIRESSNESGPQVRFSLPGETTDTTAQRGIQRLNRQSYIAQPARETKAAQSLQVLAQQLLKAVQKAQALASISEELADTLDDLHDESKLLLHQLSRTASHGNLEVDQELAEGCVQWLRKALTRVEDIYSEIKDCNTDFRANSGHASQISGRLKKAVGIVQRARSAIEIDQRLRHPDDRAIVQKAHDVVQASVSGQHELVPASSNLVSKLSLGTHAAWKYSHVQMGPTHERHRMRFRTWFTQRCFEIVFTNRPGSINLGLQTFTILPWSSEVLRDIRFNDVQAFQARLSEGRTLRYQTIEGLNLLSYALARKSADIVGFLLDNANKFNLESQVDSLEDGLLEGGKFLLDDRRDIMYGARCWFMISSYLDDHQDVLSRAGDKMHHQYSLPWQDWLPNWTKVLTFGETALPLQWRSAIILKVERYYEFESLLRDDETIEMLLEAGAAQKNYHLSLLSLILNGPGGDWLLWKDVVLAIFKRDMEAPMELSERSSLILQFWGLDEPLVCIEQAASRVCCWPRKLLMFLHDIGIDLELFGLREKPLIIPRIDGSGRTLYRTVRDWELRLERRIIGMTTGPHYDDWRIFISPPTGIGYELAGVFWSWIENPELHFIPGRFVDDDEDDDFADKQVATQHFRRQYMKQSDMAAREHPYPRTVPLALAKLDGHAQFMAR